jgi:simple sugar transport system permease protein
MAIAGLFAGTAGALDTLGWQFRLDVTQIQSTTIGFVGIAVALLGRNTTVGVALAALLFAALDTGTASSNLDPDIFDPELATSLSTLIQGLVVLFVGAEFVILYLLQRAARGRAAAGTA